MFGKKPEIDKEKAEDLLDDLMMGGDLPIETSDQAKAQAIVKLSEPNPILSDLTEFHINMISGLLTIDKWLKKNKVDSIIV